MYFILHFKIKKKKPIASGSIILLNDGRQMYMYYNELAYRILAKTKVLMTSRHVNYDSC